ncbi:MAG: choice-of-anchor Q domain-containing protein [Planctomycetaceae bacterium]
MRRRSLRYRDACETLETRALLATITVTSLEDNVIADGEVTLREAIEAANTNQSVDGSTAGNGPDRIRFASNVERVFQLADTLTIVESVEIIGRGSEKTRLSGTSDFAAFQVPDDNPGVDLTLRNLRIRGARAAVSHTGEDGSLTILNSRIRNNRSGVSVDRSDLEIIGSEFYGITIPGGRAGDSISVQAHNSSSRGNVTIVNSKITNNDNGVTIRNANLRVKNLLYANNDERFEVYDSNGDIDNSTFAFNSSDALYVSSTQEREDAIHVNHSTIVENTGTGVSTYASPFFKTNVYLTNSILADNVLENGFREDLRFRGGSSGRGNTHTHFSFLGSTSSALGSDNILGDETDPIDPMLGPLQDNGGPVPSMQPLPGSPVLDSGTLPNRTYYWSDTANVTTDLVGNRRPAGAAPDMGAVEFTDARLIITPSTVQPAEGDSVTLRVTLATELDEPLNVVMRTTDDGTATADRDFVSLNQQLNFDGAIGDFVDVTLITLDDTEFEFVEEIGFELISDTHPVLGYSDFHVTIASDETTGFGLSGDTLVGRGTNARDVVTVDEDGDQILAVMNGESFSIDRSLIAGSDIELLRGSDRLTISESLDFATTITGGLGADTITTGSGADEIHGQEGGDLIDAGEGRDTVFGGGGNDTIHGRRGGDWLKGEDGDDFITGQGGPDHIEGNAGADTLNGGDLIDSIWGGSGGDELIGGAHRDKMYGFYPTGALSTEGTDAANTMFGGHGDDWMYSETVAHHYMEGGDGDDLIRGTGTLIGNKGNDRITVSPSSTDPLAASDVRGGLGNDQLTAGAGDDTLHGGSGNDRLTADSFRGGGNNVFIGANGNDTLYGGPGNDLLMGNDGRDSIHGFEGDDTLDGGASLDVLRGHTGNDKLLGGLGRDILVGGSGADELFGDEGQDILISGTIARESQTSALHAIRAEWFSSRDFEVRQANLIDGSGSDDRVNDDDFLVETGNDPTVFDDDDIDTINGGTGIDWFFYNVDQDEF